MSASLPPPRTPLQVQLEMLETLPDGWASTRSPDDYLGARFAPFANEASLIEASMYSMLPQIDPRAAPDLLADWQRLFGPDPCQLTAGITDTTLLGDIAYQQLTELGAPTAGRFEAMALIVGITLTITEFELAVCGASVCGDELITPPQHLLFEVSQPIDWSGDGICGESVCGDVLGGFVFPPGDAGCGDAICGQDVCGDSLWASGIGCVIRREAPLFTKPVFTFTPIVS